VDGMTEQLGRGRTGSDRAFRWAAVLFAAAVALHGADHLRRGMGATPPAVMAAGMVQTVLVALTVILVFIGSRWAPHAAVVVGLVSAAGFTAAHLLPAWGPLSDSFIDAPPGARVTWFSWVTALVEIIADLVFAVVAIAVMQERHARRSSR